MLCGSWVLAVPLYANPVGCSGCVGEGSRVPESVLLIRGREVVLKPALCSSLSCSGLPGARS